jgi:hypothetical protein
MKIEQVTEYVAADGKRFRVQSECMDYEIELRDVNKIMRQLPKHDVPYGKYVLRENTTLKNVKAKLWDMVLKKYGKSWPDWTSYSADDINMQGIVSRVLSDMASGPLETAWLFLMRCDFKLGRIYDQPYYVSHPTEAELLEQ